MMNERLRRLLIASLIPALLLLVTLEWNARGDPRVQLVSRSAIAAILLIWAVQAGLRRTLLRLPIFLVPIFLYMLFQVFSIPRSPLTSHAVESTLDLGQVMLVAWFLFDLSSRIQLTRILQISLLGLGVLFSLSNLMLIIIWFSRWLQISGLPTQSPPFMYRLPGTFLGHPNIEAGFASIVFFIAIALMIVTRQKRSRYLLVLISMSFLSTIFFSNSRAGWLALLIGVTTMLGFAYKDRFLSIFDSNTTIRINLKPLIFGVIGLTALTAIVTFSVFLGNPNLSGQQPLESARTAVWGAGLNVIKDNPILIGGGPGSTHIDILQADKLSNGNYVIHPHNILLIILAESGFIGLTLIIVSILLYLLALRQNLSSRSLRYEPAIACYLGALVSVAVHNQADNLFEAPIYLLAVVILSIVLINKQAIQKYLHVHSGIPIISILAVFIGSVIVAQGSFSLDRGVQSFLAGDTSPANSRICEAAERYPYYSFHSFQCGLVFAEAGIRSNDPIILREGLLHYTFGLNIDPYWPIHWANKSMLESALNNDRDALKSIRVAIDQYPTNAIFRLLAGSYYYKLGQMELAESELTTALELDPWLGFSNVFQNHWDSLTEADFKSAIVFKSSNQENAWRGWEKIHLNDPSAAIQHFKEVLNTNPRNIYARTGLALAWSMMDMNKRAMNELEIAMLISPDDTTVNTIAGYVALKQGASNSSSIYFEKALNSLHHQTSSKRYYDVIYRRSYLPFDSPIQNPSSYLPSIIEMILQEHTVQIGNLN